MTVTIILVIIAVLALALLVWLAKGQASSCRILENPTQHLRSVDIEAFRNLVDPAEEEFLRRSLAVRDFRKIQRERLLAAVDYVSGAAHNAAILMRIGEAARRSQDLATAEAAEKLIVNATRLRLYALRAMAMLYLGMILPGTRISAVPIAEPYEQMTRLVVMLGILQHPMRGVSAAL